MTQYDLRDAEGEPIPIRSLAPNEPQQELADMDWIDEHWSTEVCEWSIVGPSTLGEGWGVVLTYRSENAHRFIKIAPGPDWIEFTWQVYGPTLGAAIAAARELAPKLLDSLGINEEDED